MKSTSLAVAVVACLLGTAASAQTPATPTAYKPGNGVVAPKLTKELKPVYPEAAKDAGIAGVVVMQAVVLADGSVGNIEVTRGVDPRLDAEAVRALKQWRFSPGTKDDQAVPVSVEIEMTFSTVRGPRVDSADVMKPGNGVTSPRLIHEVKPSYPQAARAAAITGLIEMECVVLPDGTTGDVKVTQPLDPDLDAEAVRTVRQWKFEPGTKDGQAVPVQVMVQMTFNLK